MNFIGHDRLLLLSKWTIIILVIFESVIIILLLGRILINIWIIEAIFKLDCGIIVDDEAQAAW